MFKSYKVLPATVPVLIFQILFLTFFGHFSNGHFIDHFDIRNTLDDGDGCGDDDGDCTEGMSSGLKLGLIIGGSVLGVLLLVGLGSFIYFRVQKKKVKDQIQNQKPGRKRFIHQLSRPSIYSVQDDPGVSSLPEPVRSGPMITRASINLGVENHGFHDSFDENDYDGSTSDEKTITNVNSPATPMSITDDGNITSSSSFNYNPEPNSNYNSFSINQNGRFHVNRTDISDFFSPHDDINNRRPQPPPYEVLYPTTSTRSTRRRTSDSSRSSTDDGNSIRLQNFNENQHVFMPQQPTGLSRQKRYSITPPIPVTEL